MIVLGVDPGPTQSGVVLFFGDRAESARMVENDALLLELRQPPIADLVAIEQVVSFGMPVGKEVFETVEYIGRLREAAETAGYLVQRIPRHQIKMHLCHHPRAKDGNIRQALIDRLGAPGTKKAPGPTYGVTGDCWQALAVAVVAADLAVGLPEPLESAFGA